MEINSLQEMLAQGDDNALLRFALGSAFIRNHKYPQAIEHLAKAIEFNPEYSAAWKKYGVALEKNGMLNEAIKAYKKGIKVADKKGDKQASREMMAYLKQLEKK
jgi:Flp pilus assembly protein TadD